MISDDSPQPAPALPRDDGAFSKHSYSIADCFCLALLGAACVALRCKELAAKPFWFDECFSVELARIDWRNFLHLLWWREANMSLYYVLLRIWLHFGQSPFFIRSLSVVIAGTTVPAIFWLADLVFGRRVAWIAAVLFACNAYSVRYAQEARSYSLFLLLATMSSGFLVSWLLEPKPRNRARYIAFSVLAVYAHLYALLLIVAHWLALRLRSRDGATDPQMRKAWITIGVAVLPLLIFVAKTGAGPIKWIQRPGLTDLLVFYEHLSGGNNWVLPSVIALACIAAFSFCGRNLLFRGQDWEIWRCQFLGIWLLFPVVFTALLSFARPVFLPRYMISCLPALLILAAKGLSSLRQRWLFLPVLAGILFFSLRGDLYVYGHDFDDERDASGEASNFILDHSQSDDVILFHIAETRVPYEFFRSLRAGENTARPEFTGQMGPEILFPKHGPGLDYRDFTGKPTADFVRSATANQPRVWLMLMDNGPAGKPDPTTLMLGEILPEAFPNMTRWQFPRVEVRLYNKWSAK